MKRNITSIALAFALAVPAMATAAPASAGTTLKVQGKTAPASARMARVQRKVGRGQQASYPGGNHASAWTSACYAEFGPSANYPDAAMLETCLNWGSGS